ncbi:NAD(P)/FAD-dependent oxidoreductase [Dyadobacter sandarakinus]|uniref:NAD(P)/FAD-dependent oxidoreductase n=1 Tax=Dyadobacter sandarakinus TaxID=2747268 RepID=A0ABX7I4F9_9BACT|nr:NAD(P)/FAD-dependent oxidoreductase [Dyadobacter sandarakinus]QRR00971.1 NAD(P)/FAD-dependent oxidoreductase [Dyadobacter sandarakinus]
MEKSSEQYDCAIVGGGLAGLCLSIQLAGQGLHVVLFEQKSYPFHRVCGEYISMESWDFLERLGVPLRDMNLPRITKLGVSSQKGFMLHAPLVSGGFGISRFTLDDTLSRLAKDRGVVVLENCRVSAVEGSDSQGYETKTSAGTFCSRVVCGSFGKYTPAFVGDSRRERTNYIGVKYHIRTDLAADRIELHNFQDGYCGISKVDGDRYCLCYLTTAANLARHGRHIPEMEEQVLFKNPRLKYYFQNSDFLFPEPMVISNVHFSYRSTASGGMLRLGDAAGCITPLCGNGMSMAMRASMLLAESLAVFFKNQKNGVEVAALYERAWKGAFSSRIAAGMYLQNLFGKSTLTDWSLRLLANSPALTRKLISLTHGDRF